MPSVMTNASLVPILNSTACCSSVRFLSCTSSPSFVPSAEPFPATHYLFPLSIYCCILLHSLFLVSPLYALTQSPYNLRKMFRRHFLFKTIQCTLLQLLFGRLVPLRRNMALQQNNNLKEQNDEALKRKFSAFKSNLQCELSAFFFYLFRCPTSYERAHITAPLADEGNYAY